MLPHQTSWKKHEKILRGWVKEAKLVQKDINYLKIEKYNMLYIGRMIEYEKDIKLYLIWIFLYIYALVERQVLVYISHRIVQ